MYHTAMSPVVDGNLVIVHVGGHDKGALAAFEVASGKPVWQWNGDGPAYGSPIVATSAAPGRSSRSRSRTSSASIATGGCSGAAPTTPATTTSQTPLIHKDTVIESGRDNGFTAFRPTRADGTWTTPNVWQTKEVSVHLSDVVAWTASPTGCRI